MAGNCFSMEPISVPKITSKFRKITTKIPVPESLEMFERMSALIRSMRANPCSLGQGREFSNL